MTRRTDTARQVATLTAAVAQTALPVLLTPSFPRDKPPPNVMQPGDYTFIVWAPIFATSLAYGVNQTRPSRRTSPVDAAVGWPLAGAFVCTAAWAPLVATRHHVGAQAALVALVGLSEGARRRVAVLEHEQLLPTVDRLTVLPAAAMLSAWGSAAATVNLTALLVDRGLVRPGRLVSLLGATATAAAGALLAWNAITGPGGRRTVTTRGYLATSVWALAGVAAGQRTRSPSVAATAAAAATLLLGMGVAP